jgi:hypothetical protein
VRPKSKTLTEKDPSMHEHVYVSEKILNESLHECEEAWEAFEKTGGYYEHPGSDLVIFRMQSGLAIMSRHEEDDEGFTCRQFEADAFQVFLRLSAAAAIQSQDEEASKINRVHTVAESDDV